MSVASGELRSRRAQLVGLGMSAAGLAHLFAPRLFEPMVAAVFAEDVRKHVFINGCVETALGAGVAVGRVRSFAIVATIGYVAYLAGNFLRNR